MEDQEEEVLLTLVLVDVEQLVKEMMVVMVDQMQTLEEVAVDQELLVLMHLEIMLVMVVMEQQFLQLIQARL
tara:strand:- start:791 stop:1006 length:216 start_codon:yes stop_codon:yes gene_type:complete